MQNIYALSSCYGKSALSIIRISGKDSLNVLMFFSFKKQILPRMTYVSNFFDPSTGHLVDKVVFVYFPKISSFTGENLIEIYSHGSKIIIKKLLYLISLMSNFRLARRGEFISRAIFFRRVNKYEIEHSVNAITSENNTDYFISYFFYYHYKKLFATIKSFFISLISRLEALTDFIDHNNHHCKQINENISSAIYKMQNIIFFLERFNRKNFVLKIVIVGPSNVGKSTVINTFQYKTSLALNIRGLTKDCIIKQMDVLGCKVVLYDSPGLRKTYDVPELISLYKIDQMYNFARIMICDTISICTKIVHNAQYENNCLIIFNKIDLINFLLYEDYINLVILLQSIVYPCMFLISFVRNMHCIVIVNIVKQTLTININKLKLFCRLKLLCKKKMSMLKNTLHNALKESDLELKSIIMKLGIEKSGNPLGFFKSKLLIKSILKNFCIGK